MYEITIDPLQLLTTLDNLSERQLPFATMKALNETATLFQDSERKLMQQTMTIRRPWVLDRVKIDRGDFATKQKLSVRVRIDEKGAFLEKLEPGGTRTPLAGKALAVPILARTAPTALIPANKRPRAFDFHEVGGARLVGHAKTLRARVRSGVLGGSLRVFEGNQRTILIQGANGAGLILQRVGRGKKAGLKVLYVLKPTTKVPADLHFYDTAQKAFVAFWPNSFIKWWNEAIRTARPA